MKIDRSNYEIYFIDYSEGNLQSADVEAVMLFMKNNPDLAQEFEAVFSFELPQETILYDGKNDLKKKEIPEFTAENFDSYAIAFLEGDLRNQEQEYFLAFLAANPSKQAEYELYEKTKYTPDQQILFPNKTRLRRVALFSYRTVLSYLAAASIVLLIGISILLQPIEEKKSVVKIIPKKSENVIRPKTIVFQEDTTTKTIDVKKIHVPTKKLYPKQIAEITNIDTARSKTITVKETMLCKSSLQLIATTNSVEVLMKKTEILVYEPIVKKRKNPLRRLQRYVTNGIKRRVFDKEADEKVVFLDIAQVGIKGLNNITDSDVKLYKTYNENGDVDKFVLVASNFRVARKVKNK